MLSREATHTNCIVLGLTRSRLEPTIYPIRGEHANHYTTDAVLSNLGIIVIFRQLKINGQCSLLWASVFNFQHILFFTGWIWEEMKQVGESGIEDYIGSMWNIIDFLMLTFLLASFTLDVVVPIKVGQAFSDNPLSLNVSGVIVNLSVLLHCYDASDDEEQCPSATYSIGGMCFIPTLLPSFALLTNERVIHSV